MLDLLTPKEILNIAGIVSIKCIKNGHIDGLAASVGALRARVNSAKIIKIIGYNYENSGGSTSLKKALASREKEAWGLTVLRCSSGLFTGGLCHDEPIRKNKNRKILTLTGLTGT